MGKFQHLPHLTRYDCLLKGFANGIFKQNISTFISHNQEHEKKTQLDTRVSAPQLFLCTSVD
jgi:hypothetical protein